MINSIKIAFRNTLRNKRRTLLSVLAIAIGGFASLLIGSFVASVNHGIQTGVARSSGHLHIHKKGYFDFGAGTVDQYDIENYKEIIDKIEENDTLSSHINVITPTLTIGGIAGNYTKNSSQTFVGVGVVANEQLKMQSWDGYGINMPTDSSLKAYHGGALIGKGLAKNLNLCEALSIDGCKEKKEALNSNPVDEDIADFSIDEPKSDRTTISLLAASAKGAPNIVRLPVEKVWEQTNKEMDDRFIAMPLEKAQMLVYGNDTKKVNTINVQLKSPDDIDSVADRLEAFFDANGLALEVIKLNVFNPQIDKILGMFSVIFAFVSIVIGLIAIFTVSNTMTMSIMERFNEIGTLRAMGLRRSGVRTYFLLEGMIIGLFGATLGVALALLITSVINSIGLWWTPPNVSAPTQLVFNLMDNPELIVGIWVFLVLISVLSSILPAIRASKMPIVDALRHN